MTNAANTALSSSPEIRILHVDDDQAFRDLTATFLEREDDRFDVLQEATAEDGLERLAADTTIDCIVSDYEMPDTNGITFLEQVREAHPDLPFILFTGKGSEGIASEAISAGVTDYLQKSGSPDQYPMLANRIQNAVERARATRQRQRHLEAIESSQDGISILNEDGCFIYMNQAYADLYGYAPDELVGEHWELLYQDEDIDEIRNDIIPQVDEEGAWHGTTTGVRADNTTFIEDHVLTRTDSGELVCTVRDVTEQEALREQFELVVKASTDAFWDWNPVTDDITRSDEYLRQFGYTATDAEADTDWWRNRIHPDDRDRVLTALNEAVEKPEATYDVTYRFEKKDGSYGHLRSRGYVVYDEDQQPQRMVGAHIDISHRKQREERLRALNERCEELFGAPNREAVAELGVQAARSILGLEVCAIHLYDPDADALPPVAATPPTRDLLGDIPTFTGDESIAWKTYTSDETRIVDDISKESDTYNEDTVVGSELFLPLRDNGILIAASDDTDAFGQQDVALGEILAQNIAAALEQVSRREELLARDADLQQQNNRLEEFTSVVSHDLRNPLQVAEGRLELAQDACDCDYLDDVKTALDRSHSLIDDLLVLAREGRQRSELEPVDLDDIAENCWQNVDTNAATLETTAGIRIQADQTRLKQLLENLFKNAVQHGGDDVTVTVGSLEHGFFVEDTGSGLTAEELGSITEPTQPLAANGHGIGLSIVHQVVEAHDWHIDATESATGGARFEITTADPST